MGWATLDAVAPASSSPLYFPGRGPAHQVGTVLLSGTLEPDVWVDVTSTIDAKVRALFCHTSQLADDAEEWLAEFVRSRAEEEGRRGGTALAEGVDPNELARGRPLAANGLNRAGLLQDRIEMLGAVAFEHLLAHALGKVR